MISIIGCYKNLNEHFCKKPCLRIFNQLNLVNCFSTNLSNSLKNHLFFVALNNWALIVRQNSYFLIYN